MALKSIKITQIQFCSETVPLLFQEKTYFHPKQEKNKIKQTYIIINTLFNQQEKASQVLYFSRFLVFMFFLKMILVVVITHAAK